MKKIIRSSILVFLLGAASGCFLIRERTPKKTHTLLIFSTTDEHQYIYPHDYMRGEENTSIGISGLYTIIEEMREEYPNNLLFSSGDIIQGSLLGEMEAVIRPDPERPMAIIDVFNRMGYDAAVIGNHDLTDFGLDFFRQAERGADFPWVSSNIYKTEEEGAHLTEPYVILERYIDEIPIKIGVIGFTPPQIMNWGRKHLEGNVVMNDILDSAEKYLPELKKKTDLIIALAHSGIDSSPKNSDSARENAGYYLAQLDGIDALLLGHQHLLFPGNFEGIDGIDNERGLIHGTPAVLPSSWGRALGAVRLDMRYSDGRWEVLRSSSRLIPNSGKPHQDILSIAEDMHNKTIAYVSTPIGRTQRRIGSYFSRVKDSALTQLINEAQLTYASDLLSGTPDADTPLLSAAAPFVAGREGPGYFTDVSGDINIGDVTDIYIYPNTLYIMRLNGSQLRDYLEHSALNFSLSGYDVVDYSKRAFNFDIVEGVSYTYDLGKPLGERVVRLEYSDTAVQDNDEFLIVMNNYRASGGGDFPHMTPENTFLASTSINREVIISYIREAGNITPEPSNNWSIILPDRRDYFHFRSSPGAVSYIDEIGLENYSYIKTNTDGWSIYRIDLR